MPRYLIIGSGGREHALAWKLSREADSEVIAAPGNVGIEATPGCRCVPADSGDHDQLVDLARREKVDLTIVGPEAPLCAGLADRFAVEGLLLFGPRAAGARLEGSKAFAKEIMLAAGVPTADHRTFDDLAAAQAYVEKATHPLVIKADGLAGGKGVVISPTPTASHDTLRDFLANARFGTASTTVVIEELLEGPEVSFMVVTDGHRVAPLSTSQDHKRLLDGDRGPNTGGMGAIVPAPHAGGQLEQQLLDAVIHPVLEELRNRGIEYRGFLYAGVMLTASGPRVLEFNVRLGDPETQALMVAMDCELGPVLLAAAAGHLAEDVTLASTASACCVVLASAGYPERPQTGHSIEGLELGTDENVVIFHAGTRRVDGQTVTAGGRVLGVTARADTPEKARAASYEAAQTIHFNGLQLRRDIGAS